MYIWFIDGFSEWVVSEHAVRNWFALRPTFRFLLAVKQRDGGRGAQSRSDQPHGVDSVRRQSLTSRKDQDR